ncbi:MAG: DUF2442 domain-containing protein [Phaeodactylibacter xiamenensis]|uniref:DUF2442 domain-containing protein n=1 Tax=Phaeodactylibacter xiamenensis TaxID=1524460 RepID=A0A098S9B5_9BACT|nr:DUF2442 domain-containing protein [Phaeodactylibacter xiamenensis]KGE89159.1 hypothetical protein IX84_05190 [Phaeodactylibacter xiamenensis]MCR9050300.1 DUF2442 domain-containing protein [bacterium]
MPDAKYVRHHLSALPAGQQIEVLLKALKLQKARPNLQNFECIAAAMKLPLFPKVVKARLTGAFSLLLEFDGGVKGEIDFRHFLDEFRPLEKALLEDPILFRSFKVRNGTLTWPSHGKQIRDFEGILRFHPFSIDPELLYKATFPSPNLP